MPDEEDDVEAWRAPLQELVDVAVSLAPEEAFVEDVVTRLLLVEPRVVGALVASGASPATLAALRAAFVEARSLLGLLMAHVRFHLPFSRLPALWVLQGAPATEDLLERLVPLLREAATVNLQLNALYRAWMADKPLTFAFKARDTKELAAAMRAVTEE